VNKIPFVVIPDDDSDITLDQFASGVSRMGTNLWVLHSRLEGTYASGDWGRPKNPNVLDENEKVLYQSVRDGLAKLAESVLKPSMVKLAEAIPDPEPEPDPDEIEWTPKVDRALDWRKGPVYKVLVDMGKVEALQLAIAILEGYAEVGENFIEDFLTKLANSGGSYRRSDSVVHNCPRCGGDGNVLIPGSKDRFFRTNPCKLCKGRGVVFHDGELPDEIADEEYLSNEGKAARNNGDTWTIEQEASAMGYDSLEEAKADGFDPPESVLEPAGK